MLIKFHFDQLEEISKSLKLHDIYDLILTCKNLSVIPDSIWLILCKNYYPPEFWFRAMARDTIISKPTESARGELKRLKIFESVNKDWTLEDYYKLWNSYKKID
jgi:hypothetical protein